MASQRAVCTVLFVLAVPVFAGCLAPEEGSIDIQTPTRGDRLAATGTTNLASLVLPTMEELPEYGESTREWLHAFAKNYANRISLTPINDQARIALAAELETLGYQVEQRVYFAEASPVQSRGYTALIATKPGMVEPEKHIGFVAHYDALATSNEAAYDDGSGVAAVMALAYHFALVETRKSVSLLLFDAEEMGLRTSCYYANDVARGDAPTYDIIFGYDMVGINYPGHDWALYQMMGDEDDVELLMSLADRVYRGALALPEDGVAIIPEHDRNSDERRFREIGLPIYRWAGGRNAADYPHYHMPTDTYEAMIEFAGGEEAFEQGMSMVIQTSIAMFDAADQWAFPAYPLAEQDCSFAGPDSGPL